MITYFYINLVLLFQILYDLYKLSYCVFFYSYSHILFYFFVKGEIGDIKLFKDAPSLVTYAGIDTTVKQSGQFLANNNKMSKSGSTYLLSALFIAASNAILYNPVLINYYNKNVMKKNIILLLSVLLPVN